MVGSTDIVERKYRLLIVRDKNLRFNFFFLPFYSGFSDSSVGKESACNAEDPESIPGSGISTGEGKGYPLWYSWACLVAHLVKNVPAMCETWVQSLGWEAPLEKGKATHSSCKESDTTERLSLHFT